MSGSTRTPAGTTSHHAPARTLSPAEALSTYLVPDELFPTRLAELDLAQLQMLHSRICRQLDREYRTAPTGPHPVTLERAQELTDELDTRQLFLDPPSAASPEVAAQVLDTETLVRPVPARHPEHLDELFRFGGQSIREAGSRIHDLYRLQDGQQVEVWRHGQLHRVGRVDQTAPDLAVVWIRDDLDGYRHMVHTQEDELRYHLPYDARRSLQSHPS